MDVSVVIPTYNGVKKLPGILQAMEHQTQADFEVIIVVDGSTDGTVEMLRNFRSSRQLKVIEQRNMGRAAVRNRGVREARGSLIIFYDDDMIPAVDSVQRHTEFHRSNNNAVLTGYTPQFVDSTSNDFVIYRAFLSERWVANYPDHIFKMDADNFFITTANCSIHNSLLVSLSGFDEKLTDAEDKDLAKRAWANGVGMYYDKQNVAIHNEEATCRSYIKRLREYAVAEKRVVDENNFLRSRVEVAPLKKLFYRMLASSMLVSAVDGFNFFKILPKRIRYKFYDALTFSLSEIYPSVKL
jgi:glycosyltransferase involved in cell wall biosynthesis